MAKRKERMMDGRKGREGEKRKKENGQGRNRNGKTQITGVSFLFEKWVRSEVRLILSFE